ncbi:MAG: response regulator transcription factor [Methylocystis sp.]
MRILLIEDEAEMARLLASRLASEGFVVDRGRTLDDALSAARRSAYELILLDRRLPDGDGLSLLPTLRGIQPGVRVIMLTALDALNERISGLDAGADDYLIKPFEEEELFARIRACLRRPGFEVQPPVVVGALTFDFASREASVAGHAISLRRRELRLLEELIRRSGRVSTREALLDAAYGDDAAVQPHALDTLVWRLRQRLVQAEAGVMIHLVKGVGFALIEIEL